VVARLPAPDEGDVARSREAGAETNLERLSEGRRVYAVRCGACHEAYAPASRDREGWSWAVSRMAPRAHLTAEEKALVLEYLAVFAE